MFESPMEMTDGVLETDFECRIGLLDSAIRQVQLTASRKLCSLELLLGDLVRGWYRWYADGGPTLSMQNDQNNYVNQQALICHEHLSLKKWRLSIVQQTVIFFI